MKILSIVQSAYRGTLEEQDDTVLWFNHALRNNGADVSVLLCGNAVNYLARGHDASGLRFGDTALEHPATPDVDLTRLAAAAVPLYVVGDDLEEHGLPPERVLDVANAVRRKELLALFERFDYVWHW